ncbi:hypothetical protein ATK17_3845 [Branchiibius hedensis]|uniref:Uncharacterized protein n=1 Tax=Branchiibius hedensis TaxID=672460 RepID=A0A2Y9BPI6_9MICO|nr:hypothetical protein ATK17_3845 [Branchiibius hedensis]SSA59040.1 hypothetical protein SAMN04489750_3845 [Branchiibius hedensis]
MHSAGSMSAMAAVRGRAKRAVPAGTPAVLLQGRVSPETRDAARAAADAAGISIAAYIELLVQADAREHFVRPESPLCLDEEAFAQGA